MTQEIFIALIVFAFVSSITPGPNNLMLMASGANFGLVRTIPHMLGVGLGFCLMLLLVGLGLSQLFELFPLSYSVLKYLSMAYLLFLSWKIATAPPLQSSATTSAVGLKPMTFLQAALFQWINPKAWTMGMTAISAYTIKDHPVHSTLIMVLVFGIVNMPCIASWTLAGTQIRRFLNSPLKSRVFNVTAAVLLVGTLVPSMLTH